MCDVHAFRRDLLGINRSSNVFETLHYPVPVPVMSISLPTFGHKCHSPTAAAAAPCVPREETFRSKNDRLLAAYGVRARARLFVRALFVRNRLLSFRKSPEFVTSSVLSGFQFVLGFS